MVADLCKRLGFCDLDPETITDDLSRDDIVRLVFVADGFNPEPSSWRGSLREGVEQIVDDWLYTPNGRGVKSGLPR